MIGFSDLVNADPQVFHDIADRWDGLATDVEAHHQQFQSQVAGSITGGSWTGQANQAAARSVATTDQNFATHAPNLRSVAATVRQSAANFADARSRVQAMRQQAAKLGLIVDANGGVSVDPTKLSADMAELPTTMAAAKVIAKEISGAVSSANDADQRAANAVDALTPQGATTPEKAVPVGGRTGVDPNTPPQAPPAGSDPATVRKWWDSLSQAQKKAEADSDPEYVGKTDGIPDAARDYANRKVLAKLIATTPASDKDKLAGLKSLQATLNKSPLPRGTGGYDQDGFPTTDVPSQTKGKFLLGIDTKSNGHVILATNNPDAAHNVVTWVSGVGTKLDGQNAGWASGIPDGMAKQAGGNTAVVAWMNYDAPQWSDPGGVAGTQDAQHAAPALVQFEKGLSATHSATTPMHNVLIGHSYGSSVVGEAAKAAGPGGLSSLHVNDVIAIGSPGMDVPNAQALGMPPGHVFASKAVYDPVPLSTAGGPLDPHGADPADPSFGAKVFDSGWGSATDPSASHGSYFNSGPGLTNMGHIIAGDYGAVTAPTWQELAAEGAEKGAVTGVGLGLLGL
jgi:WXG100 family type VII secretion target